MVEYNKINTIYKRDVNNIIMPYDGFVMDEIEWMKDCKFEATEKIDGTNISIALVPEIIFDLSSNIETDESMSRPFVQYHIEYHGRTERANIPVPLLNHLKDNYPLEKMLDAFGIKKTYEWNEGVEYPTYVVFGEGYGKGIQKGGNYIKDGVSFIVFDVKVGEWYLLRDSMLEIAEKMGAPTVPFVGYMTVDEAVEYVKKGFKSNIAENKDYLAEGLVMKTPNDLRLRNGQRLIFKIKTCDWEKYYKKYGTYDKVDQEPNSHY